MFFGVGGKQGVVAAYNTHAGRVFGQQTCHNEDDANTDKHNTNKGECDLNWFDGGWKVKFKEIDKVRLIEGVRESIRKVRARK